jgi:methylenetetrahydrofolate reductase (NADPH)
MERMTALRPMFIDVCPFSIFFSSPSLFKVTWGAAASTKSLTMAICEYAQKYFGVEVLMHLTCTGLSSEQIKQILYQAKDMGIRNILALRGDPPKGALTWTPTKNGFEYAVDLVRLIRQEFDDYFCIGVAGFPEGYPQATATLNEQILQMKEKVDAGADFVLTQFFYDTYVFVSYVEKCRQVGINCPIIPGDYPHPSPPSLSQTHSVRDDANPKLLFLPKNDFLLPDHCPTTHLELHSTNCRK